MSEFVSRAVREQKDKPFYQGVLSCGIDAIKYGYALIAEIFTPGEHYFPPGVVAFTDAEFTIDMLPENRIPYMGREATKLHELGHIERDKWSQPQDEVQINRDVAYKMGLTRFPFPSYA